MYGFLFPGDIHTTGTDSKSMGRYTDTILAPHKVWSHVTTFPHHFHNKNEKIVIGSDIPSTPEMQTKYFMNFIRKTLVRMDG